MILLMKHRQKTLWSTLNDYKMYLILRSLSHGLKTFHILSEYGLGMAPAQELLLGVKSDLQDVNVKNEELLLLLPRCRHCGFNDVSILGVRDEAAMRYAIDLGIAMQLTNISRDVLEDAHKGESTYRKRGCKNRLVRICIINDREVQDGTSLCESSTGFGGCSLSISD